MSISLVGTNWAEATNYSGLNGRQQGTILSWFQVTDVTQTNVGIMSCSRMVDAVPRRQFAQGFSPAAPGGRLMAIVCDSIPVETTWTKDAQLAAGLHSFISVFDGTAAVGAANRWRQYLDGVEDTANGVFVNAPDQFFIAAGPGALMDVGSIVLSLGPTTRGNYVGCCCSNAIWRDVAASPADVAAIHALGANGDLALSPIGIPRNWYRFAGNLLDSGSTVHNLTQQGAPAIAFGCPGGDPTCGGGLTVTPEDTDFYLKVRRRT